MSPPLVPVGDRLAIYLNDHLAGATAGTDLARRAASSNRDTAYGRVLAEVAEEIEGLSLGLEGKASLWQSLKLTHGDDPRLRNIDFDALIARARSQRRRLERQRRRAAEEALS